MASSQWVAVCLLVLVWSSLRLCDGSMGTCSATGVRVRSRAPLLFARLLQASPPYLAKQDRSLLSVIFRQADSGAVAPKRLSRLAFCWVGSCMPPSGQSFCLRPVPVGHGRSVSLRVNTWETVALLPAPLRDSLLQRRGLGGQQGKLCAKPSSPGQLSRKAPRPGGWAMTSKRREIWNRRFAARIRYYLQDYFARRGEGFTGCGCRSWSVLPNTSCHPNPRATYWCLSCPLFFVSGGAGS